MATEKDWWDQIVDDVGLYWEPDGAKKTIRTKALTGWRAYYLRWFKRFTMKELYIWTMASWSNLKMLSYGTPLSHDNTLLSKELERKISRIYQLREGWTIRENDCKYLIKGPLISEDGTRIIVPDHGWLAGLFIWLEKYRPIIGPVLAIVTIVILVLRGFGII